MANASQKRIASQNESATRNLRLGLLIPTVLSLLLRLLLRRSSLPPTKTAAVIYICFSLPGWFIANYLIKIGSVKREPTTKTLLASGEDLNQSGVTEWCFDVIYITYLCQVGSGAFGERFWWFYAVIPLYVIFKIFSTFIAPNMFQKSSEAPEDEAGEPTLSKRQEKLKKRGTQGQTIRR